MMTTQQRNENMQPGEKRGWWPKPQLEATTPQVDTCGWWRRPELQQEPTLTAACQS